MILKMLAPPICEKSANQSEQEHSHVQYEANVRGAVQSTQLQLQASWQVT